MEKVKSSWREEKLEAIGKVETWIFLYNLFLNSETKRKTFLIGKPIGLTMKLSVFMILQVLWNSEWCAAKALEQGSVTETGEVTPYPDTQKQIINVNNVSPEVTNILRDHNMSFDQINALKEKLIRENRTMNRNFYEVIPSTTYSTPAATKE